MLHILSHIKIPLFKKQNVSSPYSSPYLRGGRVGLHSLSLKGGEIINLLSPGGRGQG